MAFYCAWIGLAIAAQLPRHARFVRVWRRPESVAFLGLLRMPRLPGAWFVALGVALALDLVASAAGLTLAALGLLGAAIGAAFYFAQVIAVPEVRRKANSVPVILLLCGVACLAPADHAAHISSACLLTIKVVVAQIYFSSGVMKLRRSGLAWANGITLRSTLATYVLATGSRPALWLAGRPRACKAAAIVVLGFELTFWIVIPFPGLAWLYLPLGGAFHLWTALTMRIHYWIYLLPAYAVFLRA